MCPRAIEALSGWVTNSLPTSRRLEESVLMLREDPFTCMASIARPVIPVPFERRCATRQTLLVQRPGRRPQTTASLEAALAIQAVRYSDRKRGCLNLKKQTCEATRSGSHMPTLAAVEGRRKAWLAGLPAERRGSLRSPRHMHSEPTLLGISSGSR